MSDMIDIASVYEKTLRSYHFSLAGYADYERRLTEFLDLVFKDPQLCPEDEIEFLLAVFAELDPGKPDVATPESLAFAVDLWKTKPLQEILFFCKHVRSNHALVLSFYLSLLNELSEGKATSAVNTFSKFIRKDIDVRVMVTNERRPNIKTEDYLVSLCTPRWVFKPHLFDSGSIFLNQEIVERTLQDAISQANGGTHKLVFVTQQSDNKNIFRRTPDGKIALTSLPSAILLDTQMLDQVRREYHIQFRNPAFSSALGIPTIPEDCCKAFFAIAIAGAFFASYYHVILEYVLSVCKVLDHEMFTLGGLGVGSKPRKRKQNGLDTQRRAVFSFLSDHVAANLSAQMFHDWFEMGRFAGKAHSIMSSIDSPGKPFHQLLEQKSANEPTAQYAQEALEAIENSRLDRVLSATTLDAVKKYFLELKDGFKETRQNFHSTKKKVETSPRELWQALKSLAEGMEIPNVAFVWCDQPTSIARLHIDVEWVALTFKTALQNLTADKAFDPTRGFAGSAMARIEIGFSTPGSNALQELIPQNAASASLRIVLHDNGVGCDVATMSSGGTRGFGRWLNREFTHVLNSHGDVWIESRGRKLSFRNQQDITDSEIKEGTRFTIVINGIGY
jgi:hypothetical protein